MAKMTTNSPRIMFFKPTRVHAFDDTEGTPGAELQLLLEGIEFEGGAVAASDLAVLGDALQNELLREAGVPLARRVRIISTLQRDSSVPVPESKAGDVQPERQPGSDSDGDGRPRAGAIPVFPPSWVSWRLTLRAMRGMGMWDHGPVFKQCVAYSKSNAALKEHTIRVAECWVVVLALLLGASTTLWAYLPPTPAGGATTEVAFHVLSYAALAAIFTSLLLWIVIIVTGSAVHPRHMRAYFLTTVQSQASCGWHGGQRTAAHRGAWVAGHLRGCGCHFLLWTDLCGVSLDDLDCSICHPAEHGVRPQDAGNHALHALVGLGAAVGRLDPI